MVVVRCLILCSKFAKNRLSAGLRPGLLGELTSALPRLPSWIMGEGRGKGDGRAGGEGKGEENVGRRREGRKEESGREGEGYPPPNENPGYGPALE